MARSDDLKCKTEAPQGKKPNDVLFGADTPNEAIKFLQPDDAIRVSVFSLPDGESISVFEIDKSTGSECADTGTGAEFPYDPCCDGVGKEYTKAGTYYIKGGGAFKFVYSGISGTASVKYTIVKNSSVTEKMACPACKCYDTTWTWTGLEVCDGENVMREEVSNCGTKRLVVNRPTTWVATGQSKCENHVTVIEEVNNCGTTRWTATTEVCGYSPSVPFVIEVFDGCCGGNQVGYMYHPDETRDPSATVAVEDCNGVVWGYIYPKVATGRTLPVGGCGETPIGYAVNQSTTAPSFAQCGGDIIVNVPKTTVEKAGKVELATTAEATAGTSTTLAVTPAGLKAAIDAAPDSDAQTLTLAGNQLSISNGNTVTIPGHSVGTEPAIESDANIPTDVVGTDDYLLGKPTAYLSIVVGSTTYNIPAY